MRLIRAALVMMLLPLAAATLSARDLAGKWTMEGDVQGNPVNLACTVEQAADGSSPASA